MDIINFDQDTLFVEVILPLSLAKNYTYRVPQVMKSRVQAGKRVLVQFGKKRIYTAIIYKITHLAPQHYEAKYILDVVDEFPVVTLQQIQFWDWICAYYCCNMGDVLSVALPSALKWSSDTVLYLADTTEDDITDLSTDAQNLLMALISKKQMPITEIMELLQRKNVQSQIQELIDQGWAYLAEEITDKFKPLKKSFIALDAKYASEKELKSLFENLERAPKQLDVLLSYLQLRKQHTEVSRQEVQQLGNHSSAAVKALIDKQIFNEYKKVVSRLSASNIDFDVNFELSLAQQKAKYEIEEAWLSGQQVVLFHGVTSAGKTQVYIKLIENLLLKNPKAQILFLLPEIALTTQLVERIKLYFVDKIGVYHSKFSDQERVEIWNKVMKNEYQLVLGARSALFLPFQNLQLIIVDEEHEASFKQQDPAPRYQARDAAIALAFRLQIQVLLGSATPSLESWHNAQKGKYGWVQLTERFGGVQLPEIEIIDLKVKKLHPNTSAQLSQHLIAEIQSRLDDNEQVILFQNRRGFATISFCKTCGFTPKCIDCDVSLTFHKSTGKMHCHYCGFQTAVIHTCPACGGVHILQKGVGTEKIEEELQVIFPHTTIARMDIDSTRKKNSTQQIINDFKTKKVQILVGTQMVAKGLDFDDVTLIGILNADAILNFPDFRAYERAFQLMAQVAGRAGRRQKQGTVCIQTYHPEHPIIQKLVLHQYEAMASQELAERKAFNYPPYQRLIVIKFKHKEELPVIQAATYMAMMLQDQLAHRVLGPEAPLVARVRNLYLRHITLKLEPSLNMEHIKQYLLNCISFFYEQKKFKNVIVQLDVDPY